MLLFRPHTTNVVTPPDPGVSTFVRQDKIPSHDKFGNIVGRESYRMTASSS